MRGIALCAGYGGIELGLETLFDVDLVAVAEIDPGACKILKHRFPDVPNLGDLTTVDWEAVMPGKPQIDILTAGFP